MCADPNLYLFWDMDHPTAAAHAGIAAAADAALVPEPGTMGLLATGLVGIAFMHRRPTRRLRNGFLARLNRYRRGISAPGRITRLFR